MPYKLPHGVGAVAGANFARGMSGGLRAAQMNMMRQQAEQQRLQQGETNVREYKKWAGEMAVKLLKENQTAAAKAILQSAELDWPLTEKEEEKKPGISVPAVKPGGIERPELAPGTEDPYAQYQPPSRTTVDIPPQVAELIAKFGTDIEAQAIEAEIRKAGFEPPPPEAKAGKQTFKVVSKKRGKGKAEDRLIIDGKDVGRWGEIYNRWKSSPQLKNMLMLFAASAKVDPRKIIRGVPLTTEEADAILQKSKEFGMGGIWAFLATFAGQGGMPGQIGIPAPPSGGGDAEVDALEKKIEALEKSIRENK